MIMHTYVRTSFLAIFFTILFLPLQGTYFQQQPVVSCFFPCAYTPRTLPDNGQWWHAPLSDNTPYTWRAQIETTVAQTFRPERITQCLFGGGVESCYQTLCISGSHTGGRGNKTVVLKEHHRTPGKCHTPITERAPFSIDWLADYFWLPTDFVSELRFKPTINTYRVTPSFHGAYTINGCTQLQADLYLPIEHATWNLHAEERISKSGTTPYDAGYISAEPIARSMLSPNARSSFASFTPTIETVQIDPLRYARFSPCPLNKTALNCAYSTLGIYTTPTPWLFYGIGAILSAPTGTRPTGDYLFEALVGDGHYWRYGIEGYAQFHLFDSPIKESWGLITCDATLTQCAQSRQKRTFDLCNKPNSRYMLIHQPHTPSIPHYNYLANISTLDVTASIRALFEISITLTYATKKTNWSFGYRFWARTNDRLKIICPEEFPNNTWALKGDAFVYGFAIPPGTQPAATPNYIPTSESKATIESGANLPTQGSTNPTIIATARKNPNIDNPTPAVTDTGQALAASPNNVTSTNQINESEPAPLLNVCDLNMHSACSTGMLHTVFSIIDTHINKSTCGPEIHLYVRGEIDFGKASTAVPSACFNQCINIAPSEWEIALGLYVNF